MVLYHFGDEREAPGVEGETLDGEGRSVAGPWPVGAAGPAGLGEQLSSLIRIVGVRIEIGIRPRRDRRRKRTDGGIADAVEERLGDLAAVDREGDRPSNAVVVDRLRLGIERKEPYPRYVRRVDVDSVGRLEGVGTDRFGTSFRESTVAT